MHYGVSSSLERISSSGCACQGADVFPLLLAGPIRCVRAGPISSSLDVSLEGPTVQRHQDPRAELPNVHHWCKNVPHLNVPHAVCSKLLTPFTSFDRGTSYFLWFLSHRIGTCPMSPGTVQCVSRILQRFLPEQIWVSLFTLI